MNWTHWLSVCNTRCNSWNYYVHMAHRVHTSLQTFDVNPKYPYDTYEPLWNCNTRERIPAATGDGAKFACGVDAYNTKKNVTIYSIGSNGNTMFEEGIHARIPHSKIITFDPTLSETARKNVLKHSYITLKEVDIGSGRPFYAKEHAYNTMVLTTAFYIHGIPNILKIDIEGSEYGLFNMITCNKIKHVDQILIEVHGKNPEPIFQWFDKCNFLMFNKEPNIWGCHGILCGEYSFINAHFAYTVFKFFR
ncbi:hypothetical protein EPVG_00246 [Emiliania huxleyi virus 201]|nr:hypothetical protein EPVG_00246 [Emiliania huxleyi virus 201]